jgi:tryptophan-rich sensory protein
MMDEQKPTQSSKPMSDIAILGINLGIFVVYTLLCFAGDSRDGGVVAFFVSLFHGTVSTITALVTKRWAWFLGAILIIVIGFGTCVNSFHMGSMN